MPTSLDQRISALSTDIDTDVRTELHGALRTLRDAGEPLHVILALSRLALLLLDQVFASVGESRPSDNLWNCILRASNGNEKNPRIEGLRLLPRTLKENLDTIRKWSNPADHADKNVPPPRAIDAENALGMLLSVVEWFYCEFPQGPQLPGIYNDNYSSVTLSERFEELQNASNEQSRSIQAEIALLHEALRQQNERTQRKQIDPIPVPLPGLRGTFVGREAERDTLRHLLKKGDLPVVFIVAPGGYGKTELTTKVLKEVAPDTTIVDQNVSGILYLRCLRGDITLGRIFAEAGRIVGERQSFEQAYANADLTSERKLEFFFSELSALGNVWLVMDNFEDLLGSDDSIVDPELRTFMEVAIATIHKVRVIVTSRAVPRFIGSQRIRPINLQDGLPEKEAIAYLKAEGVQYGLAETDEKLLSAFVKRVHGIPKALESVIGYLSEKYPVVQFADLMAHNALFTDFDNYDTENGLKHLIAQQFASQSNDAQLALCALSVFPKPAPLAALRYLLPALEWAVIVPRLERNRLLMRQAESYELHPLVRSYAYSQIPLTDNSRNIDQEHQTVSSTENASSFVFDRASLHSRAADFFQDLSIPIESAKEIADIEPQLNQFYHLVKAEKYDIAAELLAQELANRLSFWGHMQTVVAMGEQLLNKLSKPIAMLNFWKLGEACWDLGKLADSSLYIRQALDSAREFKRDKLALILLDKLGRYCSITGEHERGIEYFKESLALSRKTGARGSEASDLLLLAQVCSLIGKREESKQYLDELVQLPRDETKDQDYYLLSIGKGYSQLGKKEEAIECWQQALTFARAVQRRQKVIEILLELGLATKDNTLLEEALMIVREIGNRRKEGFVLNQLASLCLHYNEWTKAIDYSMQALPIHREIGNADNEASALHHICIAYAEIGITDKAAEYYDLSVAVRRRMGLVVGEAVLAGSLADVYATKGEIEKATEYYACSFDKYEEVGWLTPSTVRSAGDVFRTAGHRQSAIKYYEQAVLMARQTGDWKEEMASLLHSGDIHFGQKDCAPAVACYERALALAEAAQDQDLSTLLTKLGNAHLGAQEFEQAIACYQRELEGHQQTKRSEGEYSSYLALGDTYREMDAQENAIECYEKALMIARAMEETAKQSSILDKLASLHFSLKAWPKVIEYYEQELSCYGEDDKGEAGRCLYNIGLAFSNAADKERAIVYLRRSLNLAREVSDRSTEMLRLKMLADVYHELSNEQTSIDYYEQAVLVARNAGDNKAELTYQVTLGGKYQTTEEYQLAKDRYEKACALAAALQDRAEEGRCLSNIGYAHSSLEQYETAITYYEKAVLIARELGDRNAEAIRLERLAWAHRNLKSWPKAIDCYQNSAGCYSELGDKISEGSTFYKLGVAYADSGDYQQAIKSQRQAVLLAREQGDANLHADRLDTLGSYYLQVEEWAKCIASYEQSLKIYSDAGDRKNCGYCLSNIALAYSRSGDHLNAIEYWQQALAIARETGNRQAELRRLELLAGEYYQLRDWEKARPLYEQALECSRELGDKEKEGLCLSNIASIYGELKAYPKAVEFYQQAVINAREQGAKVTEAKRLRFLGNAFGNLKNYDHAFELFSESLAICSELDDQQGAGYCFDNLGYCEAKLGRRDKAVENYREGVTIAERLNDEKDLHMRLIRLGDSLVDVGRHAEAVEYFERAVKGAEALRDQSAEGAHCIYLGGAYQNLGSYEKAFEIFTRALKISRDLKDAKLGVRSLRFLGKATHLQGNLDNAIKCYEKASALAQELQDHSLMQSCYNSLALAKLHCGELAASRRFLTQAITLDDEDPAYKLNLGMLCFIEGEREDGLKAFSHAVTVYKRALESDPRNYLTLYNCALGLLGLDQSDEALTLYNRALGMCSATGVRHEVLQDLQLLERSQFEIREIRRAIALLAPPTKA